jgi:hypothetical protein
MVCHAFSKRASSCALRLDSSASFELSRGLFAEFPYGAGEVINIFAHRLGGDLLEPVGGFVGGLDKLAGIDLNIQHFGQHLEHRQRRYRVLDAGGVHGHLAQEADALDVSLFGDAQKQPVQAGNL